MIRFFLKFVAFFLAFWAGIAAIILTENFLLNKKNSLTLPQNTNFAVFGHSHPAAAFDPKLIGNFSNLAQSGETYFYTYFKLKKILETNSQINTVFIDFSNNNITELMDNRTWEDPYLTYRMKGYSRYLDSQGFLLLASKNLPGLLSALAKTLTRNTLYILKIEKELQLGGYEYNDREQVEIQMQKPEKKSDFGISEVNITYLEKIVSLCRARGVKIFFIRSPLHPSYSDLANEQILQDMLKNKFLGIEFLDFSDFPLLDSERADLSHLNHKGAEKFSVFFDKLLQDELLSSHSKQRTINNRIRLEKINNSAISP